MKNLLIPIIFISILQNNQIQAQPLDEWELVSGGQSTTPASTPSLPNLAEASKTELALAHLASTKETLDANDLRELANLYGIRLTEEWNVRMREQHALLRTLTFQLNPLLTQLGVRLTSQKHFAVDVNGHYEDEDDRAVDRELLASGLQKIDQLEKQVRSIAAPAVQAKLTRPLLACIEGQFRSPHTGYYIYLIEQSAS